MARRQQVNHWYVIIWDTFRGVGGLSQRGILPAIQSHYKEEQIQRSNLDILAAERDLNRLIFEFSETGKEGVLLECHASANRKAATWVRYARDHAFKSVYG